MYIYIREDRASEVHCFLVSIPLIAETVHSYYGMVEFSMEKGVISPAFIIITDLLYSKGVDACVDYSSLIVSPKPIIWRATLVP